MNKEHIVKITAELKLKPGQVEATIALLDDDATIPFIARYRKEATGSLDEVAVSTIRDRIGQLRELDKRRKAILKSLEERELLTVELKEKILAAETMTILEDLYLPYRPKRRTRATIAIERGLEPFAELIFAQENIDLVSEAQTYIDSEKEIHNTDDALSGARDIIAGWVSEDADARAKLRELYNAKGKIKSKVSKGKEEEGTRFADYFDWEEPIKSVPSHRVMAIQRGEAESILSSSIIIPDDDAFFILDNMFVTGNNAASEQVREAVNDGFNRLIAPSMETEFFDILKKQADKEAIRIFTTNLRGLLMAPPLGSKSILAIDPGFRTGCKVVCLDTQGNLKYNTALFPHNSEKERKKAGFEIKRLCKEFKIEFIAIGNGTAGRETESFIRELDIPGDISVEMVNESGASVYSASDTAREEFPDYDITVRGAVSIGRRLMDPLAELVKIDPKAIGVGQYQHDVDQAELKRGLDDTVMSCVNQVGVEVSTASEQLLAYVSGLGPKLARNIIAYRKENGPFKSRVELKKVPRFGPKAFEQAAGFLRVAESKNPLDSSGVHPESYHIVEDMAKEVGCDIKKLIGDEDLRERIDLNDYVTDNVGLPTLEDILAELARPGRDPRPGYEPIRFSESIQSMEDLKPGMKLPGIVTNVTAFGAFVDIGVHHDGLVHKSEIADRYVSDPSEVIRIQQRVSVRVLNVDLERKRISLSMKDAGNNK
ncbi:MAG: Tex family protein [candidate division Zixibacteria bacterium]